MKDQSFENTIKAYLDERSKTDELFAKSYAKSNKNLKECCNFILGEAKKRGNAVAISDNEVFGMAVHYYDEDDIKVNKLPANVKSSVSKSSTSMALTKEDEEKARQAALKRLEEEQYALLRKKPAKAKREEVEMIQMSLF